MTLSLYNGYVVDTPARLDSDIRVSVPDLLSLTRQVFGPMPFRPVVSGGGGTRLPQAGDKAVVGVDEGTGESWVISWHRDDPTPPPYPGDDAAGGGGGGDLPGSGFGRGLLGRSGALTTEEIMTDVLDADERVVGPINVTNFGAPGDGSKFLWSDGGLGTWRVKLIYTLNFIDYIDGFTVSYRRNYLTSGDRTAWVPHVGHGFVPMTDAAATALITRVPEVKSQNIDNNAYIPTDAELAAFHAARHIDSDPTENPYTTFVTGRPGISNPTTDELIQWCSHKWGIPTDRVRAQMHQESKWSMDMLGDLTTQPTLGDYLNAPAFARRPSSLDVYESLGISQIRWRLYDNLHPGTEPLRWKSTAFNLDYYGSTVRFFFDDPDGRRTNWSISPSDPSAILDHANYVPGDEWLSQGGWFQPYPWGNPGQLGYIANVQQRLAGKDWTIADFSNVAGQIRLFRQPNISRGPFGAIINHPRPIEEVYVAPTVPTAPTSLFVSPAESSLDLTWVNPSSDGGAPILGFIIREFNEGWPVDISGFNVQPVHLTGLTNGVSQTFTVAAYNEVGLGPASAPATGTPVAAGVPGPPLSVTGTPGNAKVTVDWDPPISDGGSPITHYRVITKILGVSQTPIDTGSAAAGPFVVPGLANGTPYTFVVRAVNAAGTSVDSSEAGPYTPIAPPTFSVPPQMPSLLTGLPTAASRTDFDPARAVDAARFTIWRSVVPPTLVAPQWLAVNINSVSDPSLANVWFVMRGQGQPRYLSPSLPASAFTYLASDYKIRAHPSALSTCPAVTDVGWVDLVSVTANSRVERIHTGLNLSAYGWVQLYCTASRGPSGNDDVGFQLEVRNVAAGIGDSFLWYGDSIPMEAMGNGEIDGEPWPDNGIGAGAAAVTGRAAPLIVDYSTGGWTAQLGYDNRVEYIGGQPPRIWVINFGANEAHNIGVNLNTVSPAGISSTAAQAYKTVCQQLIDYAVTQGAHRVILPYIPWRDITRVAAYDEANIAIFNTIIDELVADNPGYVQLGPDFHTFFQANPPLLRDGIHPTYDASGGLVGGLDGYQNYHKLWVDWLVANVYTSSAPTVPGAPTAVGGVAGSGHINLSWTAGTNGGSAITDYLITPYIGGVAQTAIHSGSSAPSFDVTGLTNGTAYTFTVAAINAIGTGAASTAAGPYTPSGGPSTLLFSDDFESGTLSANWSVSPLGAAAMTAATGIHARAGTYGARFQTTTPGSDFALLFHNDGAWTADDILLKFWWRIDTEPGSGLLVAQGKNFGTNNALFNIAYDPSLNRIDGFFFGPGGTLSVSTPNNSIVLGTWHHIEVRHTARNPGGASITLDGTNYDAGTNDQSRADYLTRLMLWADNAPADVGFDDVQLFV